MKDLKLIPFNELVSKTELPEGDVRSWTESSSKVVHVKRKLGSLYRSLNTLIGGTSLPFNVMEVALIIDKLMERVGIKFDISSNGKSELTLLSDKGVEWLNEINEIVKIVKEKENKEKYAPWIVTRNIEVAKMIEEFMKQLDEEIS